MDKITFLKEDETLSPEEIAYWKRCINANLKIGIEIETDLENGRNKSTVQRELNTFFNPTNNVSVFGKYGVYTVKGDGSLRNGIELCTVGRKLDFLDLYEQYSFIINKIMKYNPIMNQRAGLHNHMLMDYGQYHNCLEKPFPSIILKNFLQLLRRHAPELVWITSTVKGNAVYEGEDYNHYGHTEDSLPITRMCRFCNHDTLFAKTPVGKSIQQYRSDIMNERYKFINLNPLGCIGDIINIFHVELRFPDGSLYPAQIAAQNMLYKAMLVKAAELSMNGLIKTGNEDEWLETKLLINAIRNNTYSSDDRTSKKPTDEQIIRIKERAKEFIQGMKPELDTSVYLFLQYLAETPVSMLRLDKTDAEVNEMYETTVQHMFNLDASDALDVIKTINTQEISRCISKNDWMIKTSARLGISVIELKEKLEKINRILPVRYDIELGCIVFD